MRNGGARKGRIHRQERRHAIRGDRGGHDRRGVRALAHVAQSVRERHARGAAQAAEEPDIERGNGMTQHREIATLADDGLRQRLHHASVGAQQDLRGARGVGVLQRGVRHAHQFDRVLRVVGHRARTRARARQEQRGVAELGRLLLALGDLLQLRNQERQFLRALQLRLVGREQGGHEDLRKRPGASGAGLLLEALQFGDGRVGIGVREGARRAVVDLPHAAKFGLGLVERDAARGLAGRGDQALQFGIARASADARDQHLPLALDRVREAERVVALQRTHGVQHALRGLLVDGAPVDGRLRQLRHLHGADGIAHERADEDRVLPGLRAHVAEEEDGGDGVGRIAVLHLHHRLRAEEARCLTHLAQVRKEELESLGLVQLPVAALHACGGLELLANLGGALQDPVEAGALLLAERRVEIGDECLVLSRQERCLGAVSGRLERRAPERGGVVLRAGGRGSERCREDDHRRQRSTEGPGAVVGAALHGVRVVVSVPSSAPGCRAARTTPSRPWGQPQAESARWDWWWKPAPAARRTPERAA